MSNVVFILGAGASRACGAPLMSDFLDIANNLLQSKSVEDKREEFEKVFAAIGALQAVHSKAQLDLNNIESIFTVLELGKIIQKVPGHTKEQIPEAIAALKDLIVKTLEVTMLFPVSNNIITAPKPYGDFADLLKHLSHDVIPSQSVSVITFNYDIAADVSIHRANLGLDYAIKEGPVSESKIPLLKLHGSLNWATERETRAIHPVDISEFLRKLTFLSFANTKSTQIPIGSYLVDYYSKYASTKVNVEAEPVIVPPSWNKADYHVALSNVWASAAQHLSEAEHIFIIGYSLPETDSFFRHLYALGSVGKTPLRRLEVFDPDTSGRVDARFRELLGPGASARYTYHTETFAEAIHYIKKLFPNRR